MQTSHLAPKIQAENERLREKLAEKEGELAVAYGGTDRDGKQQEWFSALDRANADNERLREALEGLMEIAELAMPDSYFTTDSRVVAARVALDESA